MLSPNRTEFEPMSNMMTTALGGQEGGIFIRCQRRDVNEEMSTLTFATSSDEPEQKPEFRPNNFRH